MSESTDLAVSKFRELIAMSEGGASYCTVELTFQNGKLCHVRGICDDQIPANTNSEPWGQSSIETMLSRSIDSAAKLDLYGSVSLMFVVKAKVISGVRKVFETTAKLSSPKSVRR